MLRFLLFLLLLCFVVAGLLMSSGQPTQSGTLAQDVRTIAEAFAWFFQAIGLGGGLMVFGGRQWAPKASAVWWQGPGWYVTSRDRGITEIVKVAGEETTIERAIIEAARAGYDGLFPSYYDEPPVTS